MLYGEKDVAEMIQVSESIELIARKISWVGQTQLSGSFELSSVLILNIPLSHLQRSGPCDKDAIVAVGPKT